MNFVQVGPQFGSCTLIKNPSFHSFIRSALWGSFFKFKGRYISIEKCFRYIELFSSFPTLAFLPESSFFILLGFFSYWVSQKPELI
ncbi:hypothetical protein MSHOH_2975 [Methanosarcina horonobensis HB-1 = JCM 15518]|uniref:Uncharacterized protein n=1 Tax=Methanosarcina horonobensis HB-1 = JCM 15518 TaxID=1434110 RepID=A0A0E3SHW0_9EURY|nr:hypothetical protein MSHOH_2975 [Methanosarcina horonobensis HB-1 = JCM 15518]